jgi:hypothetical protein
MMTKFEMRTARLVRPLLPEVTVKLDRLWELAKADASPDARQDLAEAVRAIALSREDDGQNQTDATAPAMSGPHLPHEIHRKLAQAESLRKAGKRMHEISREIGVSDTTLYNWRRRFGRHGLDRAADLASLREENRRLRRIISALVLLPRDPDCRLPGEP